MVEALAYTKKAESGFEMDVHENFAKVVSPATGELLALQLAYRASQVIFRRGRRGGSVQLLLPASRGAVELPVRGWFRPN